MISLRVTAVLLHATAQDVSISNLTQLIKSQTLKRSIFVTYHYLCIMTGVHCISCKRCNKLYIGEMKRRMADTLFLCLQAVKVKDFSFGVMRLFSSDGHNINDISVCIAGDCYKSNEVKKHV